MVKRGWTSYAAPMNDPLLDRITFNNDQLSGRPCIRGMRFGVHHVLSLMAGGMTPEEIIADHPELEIDDIRASLAYAVREIDHPLVIASAA